MINISVSEEIKSICPNFAGAAIYAKVKNSQYNTALWEQINNFAAKYKDTYKIEDIKKNRAIADTGHLQKLYAEEY